MLTTQCWLHYLCLCRFDALLTTLSTTASRLLTTVFTVLNTVFTTVLLVFTTGPSRFRGEGSRRGSVAGSHMKRLSISKLSSNEVYYAAWSLLAILKISCSNLHRQKVLNGKSFHIRSCFFRTCLGRAFGGNRMWRTLDLACVCDMPRPCLFWECMELPLWNS